ncbi:MAG TPA: radical SAM protein [Spirochaetaceae bacterium]|jgi:lysine 2,3-aminomutase|nr:radical SAM protein [Spirochaetaceae bacterium]
MQDFVTKYGLPYRATPFWLSLADEDPKTCARNADGVPIDPILAQVLPSPAEARISPLELRDPLGEAGNTIFERAVRHYRSRILVRATGQCFLFCRHCYRRSLLSSERHFLDGATIEALSKYLTTHPEIREVLVSGGDPLTATDAQLAALLETIRSVRQPILIRICTRAPIVLPARITPALVDLLKRFRPLTVVLHINHPKELSTQFLEKAEALLGAGIPLHSQTVLLRGINDRPEILTELFSTLNLRGIHPYYLFQGDLAVGTAHFRVPLSRGLAIYEVLRRDLSGLELPRYAVDAPGGGGKIYLPEGIAGQKADSWLLLASDGSIHEYPEEE